MPLRWQSPRSPNQRVSLNRAPGAIVTATDGEYAETLQPFPDSLTFVGATERPGDYDIMVSRVGYQLWTRQGVEVEDGSCQVDTKSLDVRLQPLGS